MISTPYCPTGDETSLSGPTGRGAPPPYAPASFLNLTAKTLFIVVIIMAVPIFAKAIANLAHFNATYGGF